MPIVIPTYGRSDRLKTYYNLPPSLRYNTVLVVQEREANLYRGIPLKAILPDWIRDIASTRDYIVHNLYPNDKVIMMDDDLEFAVRKMDNPGRLIQANDRDINTMVRNIYEALEVDAYHVSVSPREGANRCTDYWIQNTRAMRILGYNTGLLNKLGIKFAPYTFMCDFGVTLELLTRRYHNLVLNWYTHNQSGSNTKGGCSEQRTYHAQENAALYLASRFPDFVTVIHKKTAAGSWGGIQERVDVRIQWKRAYAFGASSKAALLDAGKGVDSEKEGSGGTEALES